MSASASNRLTLATKITLVRVFLIPVFVMCLAYKRPGIALVVFIIAGVADGVDGYIARRRGEMTELGAMLDPIADKLLMFTAYLMMGISGQIPIWLAVSVLSRDLLISIGCLMLFMTVGFQTPSPSMLGKTTTTAQMITAGAALLAAALAAEQNIVLLSTYLITCALTLTSGVHYLFFVGARMIYEKPNDDQPEKSTPAARN
ncbi:MAG: CDP-alcohol phosphatidyltransferase family protein [Nitrospinae bacterium]|nr:CDP-alcohol phosphatidyltransferase family protein [Nitrospinota bacterium]